MSFIRAKEIPPHSGNWYDYEVKCVWEKGHPRQKVIRYIGKSGRSLSHFGGAARVAEPPLPHADFIEAPAELR